MYWASSINTINIIIFMPALCKLLVYVIIYYITSTIILTKTYQILCHRFVVWYAQPRSLTQYLQVRHHYIKVSKDVPHLELIQCLLFHCLQLSLGKIKFEQLRVQVKYVKIYRANKILKQSPHYMPGSDAVVEGVISSN